MLGANDGIVSVAAIVVGVAGATSNNAPILAAGLAGLVGGAISMALGEYVSVSSQRDTQRALIAREQQAALEPAGRPNSTSSPSSTRPRGLAGNRTPGRGRAHRAQRARAHLEAKLHIDEDDVASPWHAALASALSFTVGGLLPLLAILLIPRSVRIPVDLRRRAGRARDHRGGRCAHRRRPGSGTSASSLAERSPSLRRT